MRTLHSKCVGSVSPVRIGEPGWKEREGSRCPLWPQSNRLPGLFHRASALGPGSAGIPLDTIDTSSINSVLDRLSICEVVMGRSLPNVTDTEWSVLQLLWDRGPCT